MFKGLTARRLYKSFGVKGLTCKLDSNARLLPEIASLKRRVRCIMEAVRHFSVTRQ
jgi:hypothetical protein